MKSAPGPPVERETRGRNALHMIHRWSIENPYVVIAFYVGMVAMAVLAVTRVMPRRFAPYVESPMVGVVTMMPGLSAQEMELNVSKPIEEQMVNVKASGTSGRPRRRGSPSSRWSFPTAPTCRRRCSTCRPS